MGGQLGGSWGAAGYLSAPLAGANRQRVSEAPEQEVGFKPRAERAWTKSWRDPGQGRIHLQRSSPRTISCTPVLLSAPG